MFLFEKKADVLSDLSISNRHCRALLCMCGFWYACHNRSCPGISEQGIADRTAAQITVFVTVTGRNVIDMQDKASDNNDGKRHNKFLLPVPAKAIYGSFCRTENEIFNVVNYRRRTQIEVTQRKRR